MSSYINAHASFCLWLEAFPNRLQDYHQLIKGKEEAGVSNFLKMTIIKSSSESRVGLDG